MKKHRLMKNSLYSFLNDSLHNYSTVSEEQNPLFYYTHLQSLSHPGFKAIIFVIIKMEEFITSLCLKCSFTASIYGVKNKPLL